MADVEVSLQWQQRGLEFSAQGRAGQAIHIDGNTRTAVSPVETLLIALASCMAADIVDIGGKMRLSIASLEVQATGMRHPDPPRRYLSAHLVFTVGGVPASDSDKLARALALSEEKYCSVMHSLRSDLQITSELVRVDHSAGVETSG